MIRLGLLHCHTENSLNDSTLSADELCRIAKEKGAPAVALSDHGTLMGVDEFVAAAKKYDIKPILGVEAYYLDDRTKEKSHLILYAMNQNGYQKICKAMSRGVTIPDGRVCLTDESLEYMRGGDVIATSACVQGVLCSLVNYNFRQENKALEAEESLKLLIHGLDGYDEVKNQIKAAEAKWSMAKDELKEATSLAKTPVTAKQKQVDRLYRQLQLAEDRYDLYVTTGKEADKKKVLNSLSVFELEEDEDLQSMLDAAHLAADRKKASLASLQDEIKNAQKSLTDLKQRVDEAAAKLKELKVQKQQFVKCEEKIQAKQAKIKEIRSEKLTKDELLSLFDQRLNTLLSVFGENFYIEIQYHGMEEEKRAYQYVARVARRRHIPLVAANDVHVGENTEDAFKARQIRRSCRYNKWEENGVADTELYIKDDEELRKSLLQIFPNDVVDEAMFNIGQIVDACNMEFEENPKYYPKAIGVKAIDELNRLTQQEIPEKYGDQWDQEHAARLDYELSVIDAMGYSDYFVIVEDIVRQARKIGALAYDDLDMLNKQDEDMSLDEFLQFIEEKGTQPNLSVGLGRGSGAGSMVCYLLGITNIDPMKYNLLFERFLNPERISMPDIDSDFRSDIKAPLLVYLKKRYGERAIAQILTKAYLQGKSAIDKSVMILGRRDMADNMLAPQEYRSLGEKLKKKDGVDFSLPMKENENALLTDCESAAEEEIVHTAVLMDQNLDHTSIHAAGVIISDNEDLSEHIPVVWDSKYQTWKTQCVQCEKHGLLKIDLLLLRTLDIITYTLRLLKETHPQLTINITNLPIEQKVIEAIFAQGDTKCVFQFESQGMVSFLKQMHPTSIEDIIAANAMYRPGPMDFIPEYIQNHEHPEDIKYDCPKLEPILKETYGIIIYQEQVMQIFRDLAGYSYGRSDLVRRAMAKKHEEELLAERSNFVYGNSEAGISGCINNGIDEKTANQIFDKMIDFASYAFNKSHAAAYSMMSYMTAWLKYYYPAEFLCANLVFVKAQDEIPSIIYDIRKRGIKVLPPDVNKSKATHSIENGNIRFGLAALRNVKNSADKIAQGSYTDFKSFVESEPGKQAAEACIYSGACDALSPYGSNGRLSMLNAYNDLSSLYDKIISQKRRMERTADDVKAKEQMAALEHEWVNYKFDNSNKMSLSEQLEKEREYASVYFSGNPLDPYNTKSTKKKTFVNIDSLESGQKCFIRGAVSEQEIVKTKSTGQKMLVAKATDYTDTVAIVMFPETYAKLENSLQPVMSFSGKLDIRDDGSSQFIVYDAQPLPLKNEKIVLWVESAEQSRDIFFKVKQSNTESGFPVYMTGPKEKLYNTGCKLPEELVKTFGISYRLIV